MVEAGYEKIQWRRVILCKDCNKGVRNLKRDNTKLYVASIFLPAIISLHYFVGGDAEANHEAHDIRYCGGYPERQSSTVRVFRAIYACPSTGQHEGACPQWQVDHVIPLSVGGCDVVHNLQWLPNVIKTGKKETCSKDRWERIVYRHGFNEAITWDGCYINGD